MLTTTTFAILGLDVRGPVICSVALCDELCEQYAQTTFVLSVAKKGTP